MLLLYKEAKPSAKLLLANTNIHFCDFSQLGFVLRIKFRPSSAQPSESSLISPLLTEMAEGSMPGMPETDITALTEALYAQQQLLQKLYSELDQEREASSTAADEALSMILRLQGEKSAMKMEASQYKRLAEEKICHAEEALAIFEDLIYQKEMEIASLEFQLQAYRYKLLSMGCSTELGAGENVYPENLLFQRSDLGNAETGVSGTIRRINSLPPLELRNSSTRKALRIKTETETETEREKEKREREREREEKETEREKETDP
ncbi:unnamed protein product [Prunus armeniaca]|uniref:GTD-binding domain-containing protein n=1 Tax=Prunus armeniaca TaxID=36596 RepID=A0A6J5XZY1_PRUAR|nr:unnamed protein product [Prunus armeniaca]